MERERRSSSGLPLGNDCYFARLASGMRVRDEDLFGLFEELRIAVHLTGGSVAIPSSTGWEPDPRDYPSHERGMVSALSNLLKKGGYVWLEHEHSKKARIGVVVPGTTIEIRKARRTPKYYGRKEVDPGTEVALVTVRLKKVVYLQVDDELALRASRPLIPDHVNRSLVSWRPDCGASRMISMFERGGAKSLKARWNGLPAALRTTVCVEFLRHHGMTSVPRLRHLLLPPTKPGRDVDIYGVAESGKEILAQVPFGQDRDKEDFEAKKKAQRLRKYENSGAILICFVPISKVNDQGPDQEQKLFEGRSLIVRDGVTFIPVEEVLKWVEGEPAYAEKLFFA